MPRAEKMAVAMLDILAFKARLRNEGPETIFNQVMAGLPDVIANATIVGEVGTGFPAKVRTLSVSDTVVVFRSVEWEYEALAGHSQIPAATCIRAVGGATAEIIRRGFRQTPPVLFRGAITFGECLIHTSTEPYCYLGAPIVEAYELEQAQEWMGAALGASAAEQLGTRAEDALMFLKYPVPLKPAYEACVPQPKLAVNWLYSGMNAEMVSGAFGASATDEGVERKRRNTLAFFGCFENPFARPPPEVRGGD